MHKALLDALIASVRRRVAQGDCPTEPAYTTEMLEHAICDLADSAAGVRVDEGGADEDRAELASLLASWREAKRNGLRRLTFGLWKGVTPRHEGGGAVSEAGEVERLRAALAGLVDAVVRDTVDNNSISGFTGARLSDARAALASAEPVESAAEPVEFHPKRSAAEAGEPIRPGVERLREALQATAPILHEFTAELGQANRNADFLRVRHVREQVVDALTASQNGDA